MNQNLIFYPCLALVLWTAFTMFRLFRVRISHVKDKKVDYRYFKTYDNKFKIPNHLVALQRNFGNLFEVPTAFYGICAFLLITQKVDFIFLMSAWSYFTLRVLHSVVHTTSNKLKPRMIIFGVSNIVLLFMWIRLGLQLL